jgi:uncharacterized RDD family membrane protein YckC
MTTADNATTSPTPPPTPPPAPPPAPDGAPKRRVGVVGPNRRGTPAGFVTRLVAYSIDAVIIVVLLSVSTFVLNAIALLAYGDRSTIEPPEGWAVTLASVSLVGLVYLTLGWWLFGRTVGKLVMGVRVVDIAGQRPSFAMALVRALMYSVSAILALGFLWIGFTPARRGWHDRVARTWVVYDWDAHTRTYYDDDPLPPLDTEIAPTC